MKGLSPLKIGPVLVKVPLALGPMAGVTDNTFRGLCAACGCGLLYTEMVSAKALVYHNAKTEELLYHDPSPVPIGVQLFGSEPEIMAEAAVMVQDCFDFIDINAGCPVPKVVGNHEGSALLKDPDLFRDILLAMTRRVHVPVTVKMRKGFLRDGDEAQVIGRIAQDCGAAMVALHGRTREDYYGGRADWESIARLREKLSIPVIGNGDIVDAPSAERMLAMTGCDGLMIGRAALGNPWIFEEVLGKRTARVSGEETAAMIRRHAMGLVREKGEYIAVREMRKHVSWYVAGRPYACEMRRRVNETESLEALLKLSGELLHQT